MVIRKQNSTKPRRRKEHRSFNNAEENSNHTEGNQRGPPQIPPNVEPGKKMEENGVNEPNGARGDERSIVVFHVHQRKDIRRKL